ILIGRTAALAHRRLELFGQTATLGRPRLEPVAIGAGSRLDRSVMIAVGAVDQPPDQTVEDLDVVTVAAQRKPPWPLHRFNSCPQRRLPSRPRSIACYAETTVRGSSGASASRPDSRRRRCRPCPGGGR